MSNIKMGSYKFLSPFDTIVENIKLTKISNRNIKELLDAGIDVYKLVYEKVGLDRKQYEDDVVAGVNIYVFINKAGEYFYVPSRYVRDNSNVDSILYTNKLIGINLGPVPKYYDLSNLLANIDELVIRELGVRPSIKVANVCEDTYISKETHNLLEAKRDILRNESISPFLERLQLEATVRKQNDQINKLKCAIKYLINNYGNGINDNDFLENIDLTITTL